MKYSNLNYLSHSKKSTSNYLDFIAINDNELLVLSSLLHRSLHIDEVLMFYLEFINTMRSVCKVEYVTNHYSLNISKSITKKLNYEHLNNYKIFNLSNNNLGFIKIYTSLQIDTYFNQLICNTVAYLSSALKNCIQYKAAIDNVKKDFLTKLNNRQSFDESIDTFIAQSLRNKQPFSFMIIDIDYFKKINDTYGHNAGDQVLINISKLMSKNIRKSDMIFRYGGEEFCILLPNTGKKGAFAIAEKIRTILEETTIKYQNDHINVTASFGISLFDKSDNKYSLIKRADQALYISKADGRNSVNFR